MENDLSLIEKIKTKQDEESLEVLIERHSGIYISIVEGYLNNDAMRHYKESVLGEKDITIYTSALSFDADKSAKFSTYLANTAKWKCLNLINKIKRQKECSLEESSPTDYSDNDFLIDIDRAEAFTILHQALEEEKDERVKKIIDIRYNSDDNKLTSWKVIAKEVGLSIQGCINLHNKFLQSLKKRIK